MTVKPLARTTTRKVGPALKRVIAARLRGVLDPAAAAQATDELSQILVSARVRNSAAGLAFQLRRASRSSLQHGSDQAGETGPAAPNTALASSDIAEQSQQPEPQAQTDGDTAFDPYAFGLVPLYQREGATAVAAKLETVQSVDHLRSLARAQQIALPANVRRGDVAPDIVRGAIVKAVAKRIADRRAAAS